MSDLFCFWFRFSFYVGFILVLFLISFYVKFFGFYAGSFVVLVSVSDLSDSKNHFVNGDNKKRGQHVRHLYLYREYEIYSHAEDEH